MMGLRISPRLLCAAVLTFQAWGPQAFSTARTPDRLPDVAFTDIQGRKSSIAEVMAGKKALVVAATDTRCPIASRLLPALARIQAEYSARDVAFLFINPNPYDRLPAMKAAIERHKIDCPYIVDNERLAADLFGMKTSTEVLVADASRRIVYRGAVNDQYTLTESLAEPAHPFLTDALNQVLGGRAVELAVRPAPGCFIGGAGRKTALDPKRLNFAEHIKPIVQRRCVRCHNHFDPSAIPLETYEDLQAAAPTIQFTVRHDIMPPWPSVVKGGPWANDLRLAGREKQDLLRWLKSDMPRGPDTQSESPPAVPVTYGDGDGDGGWQLGEPDAVIEAPEPIVIPPAGKPVIRFQYVRTKFKEDRWLSSVEVKSSVPKFAIHHIGVNLIERFDESRVASGRGIRARVVKPGDNSPAIRTHLSGIIPGSYPTRMPEGYGKFLPAGAEIEFIIHYETSGVGIIDRPRIGLRFLPGPPKYRAHFMHILNTKFEIPPGHPDYRVTAEFTAQEDMEIESFHPHMHYRGKSMKVEMLLPGGRRRVPFEISNYKPKWQLVYRLKEPVRVPKGTKITVTARFDNSADNKINPAPHHPAKAGMDYGDDQMIMCIFWREALLTQARN
jgi:hypothetical protein